MSQKPRTPRINPNFADLANTAPPLIKTRMEDQIERKMASMKTEFSENELTQILRETYKEDFTEFVRDFWGYLHPGQGNTLKWNWHIDAICEHLMAQSRGQIQRLIINIPPGAGKSILVGVLWPCWEWTFNPSCQTIATSMSERLATRDNQRAKWVIESELYQSLFPLELRNDSSSAGKFTNEHFGYRQAVPFTSITGSRGDRVIIDDPISGSDIQSEQLRVNMLNTYWSSVTTRINNPKTSTFTLVQQRLHMNDLVGDILEKDGRWDTLILPMEFTKDYHLCKNPIGFKDPRTEVGELMFPEHWDKEDIKFFRAEGEYKYAAQFQQNPVPTEDGFFREKNFRRWTRDPKRVDRDTYLLPEHLHYFITSDHALGLSDRSDFNVVRVWGLDENKNIWLVDSLRDKITLQEAMGIKSENGKLSIADRGALHFVKKYRPLCWYPESDNNFKSMMGMITDTMRASGVFCRIELVPTMGKDKQVRAAAFQGMSQLGMVYLPESDVGDIALDEYKSFPVGKHDDQVDADSILPLMISKSHAAVIAPGEDKRKNRDGYDMIDDESGEPKNWRMFF